MPKMAGIELATQLQIERPDFRVWLMSGMAAGMLLSNEGRKPFMCNLLKERVRHLLQEQPQDEHASYGARPDDSGGVPHVRQFASRLDPGMLKSGSPQPSRPRCRRP
jgi:hypothetical protein